MKYRTLIPYILFIWATAMVAWLFLELSMLDGEVLVREPNIYIRTFETFLAFGIFGFSVGVFAGFIKRRRNEPVRER